MLKRNKYLYGGDKKIECARAFQQFSFVETANANYDDGVLLYYSTHQQTNPDTNISISEAFEDIENYFEAHPSIYTEIYNGYGEDTNRQNILNKADYFEANHDGLAFFHYGHWCPTKIAKALYYNGYPIATVYIDHWPYYPSDYSETGVLVKDSDVFPHTDQGKHNLVFLWTCVNGYGVDGDAGHYDYGINDPPYYREGTGAVGMPYAFTHKDDLEFDGYSNPDNSLYCFMGFQNISKPITEVCEGTGGEYIYQDFLTGFYYHGLNAIEDLTIHDALDAVCDDIWGTSFGNSPISDYETPNPFPPYNNVSCGLIVWGNTNLKFPKEGWE